MESQSLYNCQAEQAVLGAILLGEKVPALSYSDFCFQSHQQIFGAMVALENKNQPIDTLTVEAELQSAGVLGSSVQQDYVRGLLAGQFVSEHIDAYANQLKEKSILRHVSEQCSRLQQMAIRPGATSEEVLNAFQQVASNVHQGSTPIVNASEAIDGIIQRVSEAHSSGEWLTGVPTGFQKLDGLTLGWQASDLIIVAGRPSMGKSSLALGFAQAAARAYSRVYFASLEMSSEQLMLRLLSMETGISARDLRRGRFSQDDWGKIAAARDRVAQLDISFDETSAISDAELCRRVRRERPDLLIVDYLQLMRSAQPAQRKDLEIGNITGALKGLAKDLHIPVILLSQLNREIEKRDIPMPKLSDLRESGAIEQDADLVLAIYRDIDHSPTETKLICLKHRNGPIGSISLDFMQESTLFRDPH